ncbi:hypothetical protein HMPREF1062_02457 [Bacteroides cellulosilyticus CL02T12C19]|uniref:DUF4450 domain-containing protein n=1 Tax=Bacteroides cellulosilyticus CL02T12C19 TaxID=997874 RepID=I9QR26_9BACE|nr:DUF4450 domain-containing protein [Bacteroides cellulosilyticus]EIY31858.1 hypothetical protein HMPREF1062_02457 [Bacteroides cellulosilyticus CL02T12C19]
MKQLFFYILISLLPAFAYAQYTTGNKPQSAGDRIESTSYNDHKRGAARTLQYRPDGEDFVSVNGKNRYTRALYGSHTAFRLETSDRPIFAVYEKRNSKNIHFHLVLADSSVTPLEETAWCESRYTPGRRSYRLKHPSWGADAELQISALALPDEDAAIWKITPVNMPVGAVLRPMLSEIRLNRLSRNGDMGADPPGCFDAPEQPQQLQSLGISLFDRQDVYVLVRDYSLVAPSQEEGIALYNKSEQARADLASRIRIITPDPYFNTLGGALAVAADGIWDGEVWLHGAIGWRMPLSGWRAAYTGDALGWHDRARTHFNAYAASQVTEVPNTIPHPAQDSALALARSEKKWGTPQYSNGYICRNPRRNDQMHHYDMNLCYIDELLWHFNWTGDLEYARRMWPVLTRHLAWEKRNYDPDNDGLYDAYACIWASDALYYNSGAVTHSSAYNYRSNRLAAMIAEKIGEDPAPYREEADRILKALNARLWMPERGHWAEFQDFMGHKRLHTSPGVWTIYHALDSDIADPFQAYLATSYVDREIPHIPVRGDGLKDEGYATISTTNWLPYSWSINNVAFAEVMHTALAYFQAGRADAGFHLLKSSVLDGMYLGESPGNFGQISFYDAARGECYRDFGDPIGVASRVLIQGLYGILPDAMNGRLLVKPGLPSSWPFASLHTPDIDFDFKHTNEAVTSYTIIHRLPAVRTLELQFPAQCSEVAKLTVNGKPVTWTLVENSITRPVLSVMVPASSDEKVEINIEWGGEVLGSPTKSQIEATPAEAPVRFVPMQQGDMKWWAPVDNPMVADKGNSTQFSAFAKVNSSKCEPVVMDKQFNSAVTDIFRNEYLSPRSPYTTLQIPKQGIGEWCHPLHTVDIDDSGLRSSVQKGVLNTKLGVPFRTPAEGPNIAFTSLWDNYPDSLTVSLKGKASRAYLLMAGSTNHMQCHIDNGLIRVYYKDGTCDKMALRNPDNWAPIEHIFFEDGMAFNRHAPALYRLRLKTGEVSNNFGEELGFPGASRELDGGAAILLEMPLNPDKKLSHLVLETLSNDVVIGLMGITLQR